MSGHRLALAAATLLVLSCAAPTPGGSSVPVSSSVPASSSTPATLYQPPPPPASAVVLPPARLDSSGMPGGYTEAAWLDQGGTRLTVIGQGGSCTTVVAELIGEDSRSVSVRLIRTRTTDNPCTAVVTYVPLTVTLSQPLGERVVVLRAVQR